MTSPAPVPTFAYERQLAGKAVIPTLLLALALPVLGLGGCAATGKAFDKTLAAVGMKEPAPEAPREREVPVRLIAGANLNSGSGTTPLTMVVRLYALKERSRFEQARFDAFLDEAAERVALGDDLAGVSEATLSPGQTHATTMRVPGDARFVGAVALFRSPAGSRWRFVFDADAAERAGVTLGLHACAMTTTSPALLTALATESHSLTSVNCAGGR